MPSEAEMLVVDTCRSRGHFSWSTPSYRRGGVGVLSSRDLCEEGDTSSSGASFGCLTKVESPGGGQGDGGGCPATCATDGGTNGCTSSALAKPFPVAGPLATLAAGVVARLLVGAVASNKYGGVLYPLRMKRTHWTRISDFFDAKVLQRLHREPPGL